MRKSAVLFGKAGLLVVVFSWFAYTTYRFDRSIDWLIRNLSFQVSMAIQESIIPIAMGTFGLGVRTSATLIAMVAVINFLWKKEILRTVKLISFAALLEAAYFLTFIPAAINYVFFPGILLVFVESGIPIMAQTILMPIALLKLRSKMGSTSESYGGTNKWGCIVGSLYLFIFWLNFSMQWVGIFIMPETLAFAYPGYGINYVLKYPLNMFSFFLTCVGLLLLLFFFFGSSFPIMKGSAERLSLKRVGVTLTALGGYFIIVYLLLVIFGSIGGYSLWDFTILYLSVDLWCISLPALGIPLIFY